MSTAESTPEVQYRDIPGFPGHRVGDDGSVWSRRPRNGRGAIASMWRLIRARKRSAHRRRAYLGVVLGADGRRVDAYVHRLVLLAFVGPCPPGMEACHGNGDPADNRLVNLRWDTSAANKADSVRHGTFVRGERNGLAKLTEEGVREIRRLCAPPDGMFHREAAAKFGVSRATVTNIMNRKEWAHVAP